jgi:DMSO/TMAO reductase YedYZ heme-binding membrane subunit
MPNPFSLADTYQQSFALGGIALIILLAMALTSFDRAFRGMGAWWFRLHRLVYAAVLLAVLHAFMIGSHATDLAFLIALGVVGALLGGLHIYSMVSMRAARPSKLQIVTVTYAVLFFVAIINYGVTQRLGYNLLLQNHQQGTGQYHESHN